MGQTMFSEKALSSVLCARHARLALMLISASCLMGCANFQGSIAPHVSLEDIVDNVQCELKEAYLAYQPKYPWLDHWAASFTLTMKREDKGGITPKLDYLEVDRFGLGITAEASSDTIRSMTTKRTLHLRDLPTYKCKQPRSGVFTGRLGLFESLNEALHERGVDDVAGEEPDDLGYRIDFSVRLGAGVTPTWIFTRIPGVGAAFAGSSETTHTLDIAFSDATSHAAKVCVVNLQPGAPYLDCTIAPSPPATKRWAATRPDRSARTPTARGRVSTEVRQRLDSTLQRLQLENLLPQRSR
jgi:hypothetical protein